MIQRFFSAMSLAIASVLLLAACGSQAPTAYDADATDVALNQTATVVDMMTEGAIIPSDTPMATPTPTEDFAATEAAMQAATTTAQANIDASATAEQLDVQATADAQATIDAEAAASEPGSDDPLAEAIAAADPVNGENIFNAVAVPACGTCHYVDSEDMLVGPGQYNLFARTVERIANGTIEADGPYSYIYNSIIHPGDYIVDGYANAMPAVYEAALSEQELYDLVAYLVTLGDE